MNKFYAFILVAPICLLQSNPAEAKIKFDFIESIQTGFRTVSDYAKKAQEKLEEVSTFSLKNLLGDGFEGKIALDEIKATAGQFKDNLSLVKSNYDSMSKTLKGEVVEEDDTQGEFEGGADDLAYDVTQNDAYKMVDLQSKKKNLEENYALETAAAEVRLKGDLGKTDNNLKVYKEQLSKTTDASSKTALQKNIADLEEQKKLLQENFATSKQTLLGKKDTALESINSQIDELYSFIGKKTQQQDTGVKKVDGIFDDNASKETLFANAIDGLFIPSHKPEMSDAIAQVRSNRANQGYSDNKEAYARILQIKDGLEAQNARALSISQAATMQEGSNSAESVATALTAEEIQALLNQIELMILDLKMSTANDINVLTTYKKGSVGTNEDLTTLNLCDYKYNSQDFAKSSTAVDEQVKTSPTNDLKSLIGGIR